MCSRRWRKLDDGVWSESQRKGVGCASRPVWCLWTNGELTREAASSDAYIPYGKEGTRDIEGRLNAPNIRFIPQAFKWKIISQFFKTNDCNYLRVDLLPNSTREKKLASRRFDVHNCFKHGTTTYSGFRLPSKKSVLGGFLFLRGYRTTGRLV